MLACNTADRYQVLIHETEFESATGDLHWEIFENHVRFSVAGVGNADFAYDLSTLNNRWAHLAATADAGSDTVKLYVNGALVESVALSGLETMNLTDMQIGNNTGVANFGFSGTMDEVRIWNTARTDQQIADNYNHTLAGSQSGLQLYYTFGEASGTVADQSGSGHAGTVSGAVRVDTAPVVSGTKVSTVVGINASGRIEVSTRDGDTVTTTLSSDSGHQPTNGTVSIDSSTHEWVYHPNLLVPGTDSFVIDVQDGSGFVHEEQVDITISAAS